MTWKPATLEQVLRAMEIDWIGINPSIKADLSRYLVEPKQMWIERQGLLEKVFIVAQKGIYVVFFEDIEELFCIAEENNGLLDNYIYFNNIAVVTREFLNLVAIAERA